jgi:hypothetical protein
VVPRGEFRANRTFGSLLFPLGDLVRCVEFPPGDFAHLMVMDLDLIGHVLDERLRSIGFGLSIFASAKFFLFSREALFGEFRLSALLQVACWSPVSAWQ